MRSTEKLYSAVLLAEGIVLLVFCVLSLVWLWRVETEQRYTLLHGMLIGTLILSFVLIPIESALFCWYRKRSGEKAFQPAQPTAFVLYKLPHAFAALWLIHFLSTLILAYLHQWKNGSDIYMFHARPGSRMIFLAWIGASIPQWFVPRKKGESPV